MLYVPKPFDFDWLTKPSQPPELLTSILEKAEELSTALWGDAESTKDELDSTLRVESESLGM